MSLLRLQFVCNYLSPNWFKVFGSMMLIIIRLCVMYLAPFPLHMVANVNCHMVDDINRCGSWKRGHPLPSTLPPSPSSFTPPASSLLKFDPSVVEFTHWPGRGRSISWGARRSFSLGYPSLVLGRERRQFGFSSILHCFRQLVDTGMINCTSGWPDASTPLNFITLVEIIYFVNS